MGSSDTDSPGHGPAEGAHPSVHGRDIPEAICELSVTADDAEWLAALARTLVEKRLVACANIFSVRSVYRWDSLTQDHRESRVAFHTRLSLFDEVSSIVTGSHPYDVPALFAVPFAAVSDSYRSWVLDQTRPPDQTAAVADDGSRA